MDKFEKVERLAVKAGVSYEDAKWALEESNGDMLDALILLERIGKTEPPKKSSYSTQYEDQAEYMPVERIADSGSKSSSDGKFKEFCRKAWHELSSNFLIIKHKGELFAKLPLWAMILLILVFWHIGLILLIVSLFFGFTYRFEGGTDLKAANDVMEKASGAAEKVKEEFRK